MGERRDGTTPGALTRSKGPYSRWPWIGAIYAYSVLHILSWRLLLEGNGHGWWEAAFTWFFSIFFLPLNLLVAGPCRLVWGSFNIFEAKYVFGIVADVAIASMLSTTIVVGAVIRLSARWRLGGHTQPPKGERAS